MRTALLLALLAGRVALAANPNLISAGNIHFAKVADSSFDPYTMNPTQPQKDFMTSHYVWMLVFSPYFDTRLSWFPNGYVYKDLYAIYVGSADATNHPEWILKDGSANKLYIPFGCSGGTCPQYAGDPGNAAFRTNWINAATTLFAAGYPGMHVDDVNLLLSRVSDGNGNPVVPIDPRTGLPMTEANWRSYMASFTEQIRTAFPTKVLVHNALWWIGTSDPSVQREIAASDVVEIERGFNDTGIVGGAGQFGYETMLGYIGYIHGVGRHVWLNADAQSTATEEYGEANYFAVNDGQDAMGNNLNGTPGDWSSAYDVELGDAAGPWNRTGSVVTRTFSAGKIVVVEPGAGSQTVALGGSYVNLSGATVTSVTLSGGQGAVLRAAGVIPCLPH